MSNLRTAAINLAASLPNGDPLRRELIAAASKHAGGAFWEKLDVRGSIGVWMDGDRVSPVADGFELYFPGTTADELAEWKNLIRNNEKLTATWNGTNLVLRKER